MVAIEPRGTVCHSPAISELPDLRLNDLLQLRRLIKLLVECFDQPLHLFLERLAVLLNVLGSNVPAWREHETVRLDLLRRSALAESTHILVDPRTLLASPRMVCPGNSGDLLVREFAVDSVREPTQLPGVDEQGLPTTIAELAIALVPSDEPEANRDRGVVE